MSETFSDYANVATNALNMVDRAVQQSAQNEIQTLQKQMSTQDALIDKSTKRQIKDITDKKNSDLKAIQDELAHSKLSTAERNALTQQEADISTAADAAITAANEKANADKAASDAKYQAQMADAQRRAWEFQHAIDITEAASETAKAIIVALSGAPPPFNAILAEITAAMAAVQMGIIMSQSAPAFHEGGVVGGNQAPGTEIPVILQAGETVRTIQQEKEVQKAFELIRSMSNYTESISNIQTAYNSTMNEYRGGNIFNAGGSSITKINSPQTSTQATTNTTTNHGATVIININSPIPSGDWVKKSIEDGLRKTGLTVDKFLVNRRSNITL